MIQKRILVVDDVPDWRAMLTGLLSEEGYHVKAVGSSSEALRLLARERFHVAVLDVRLDETDEGNTEGLNLMHRVRTVDPTMAIIILTGYPTLDIVTKARRPDETGISPAFDFVEKDKISQDLLPGIKRALESVVRINDDLVIRDEENFFNKAAKRLRFVETRKPPEADLQQQIDELFRKLFSDCQEIAVRPVSQGYSGTVVVRVKPHYHDRGPGEMVIAKCGERPALEREVTAYDTRVKGVVGGHRLPQRLDVARTRSLGGVIYSFAGVPFGEVRDFATLYQEESLSEVEKVIGKLFRETCFPWSRKECSPKFFYFTEHYRSLLGLEQTALERAFNKTLESKRNKCFELADETGEMVTLIDQDVSLPNPVWFVGKHPLFCPTYVCTVHGDLNGWNVLVDRHGDVWLIDFGKCGEGHILEDFAALESFVKFSLVSADNLSALYGWERGLLASADFRVSPSLANDLGIEELAKAFATVCRIRHLAYEALGEHDMTEYYMGLLFHALKILTILDLPRKTREHALISAALICERLGEIRGSEFSNA